MDIYFILCVIIIQYYFSFCATFSTFQVMLGALSAPMSLWGSVCLSACLELAPHNATGLSCTLPALILVLAVSPRSLGFFCWRTA